MRFDTVSIGATGLARFGAAASTGDGQQPLWGVLDGVLTLVLDVLLEAFAVALRPLAILGFSTGVHFLLRDAPGLSLGLLCGLGSDAPAFTILGDEPVLLARLRAQCARTCQPSTLLQLVHTQAAVAAVDLRHRLRCAASGGDEVVAISQVSHGLYRRHPAARVGIFEEGDDRAAVLTRGHSNPLPTHAGWSPGPPGDR